MSRMWAVLLVAAFVAAVSAACPECDLPVDELIRWHGYPAEVHQVTTSDGFTLTVHRIPHGRNTTASADADTDADADADSNHLAPAADAMRPVVLLQHGLLDSSFAFVANYPNESLAYILADAGFDVWMGNNRGNLYAQPPAGSNWQFSWDQMAQYDDPAMIQYILSATGAAHLGYVGHSEGTTQMFAAYTYRSQWLSERVNMFVAMAPVAYVAHQGSPFLTALVASGLDRVLMELGVTDFLGWSNADTVLAQLVCAPNELTTPYCEDIVFLMCGVDPEANHNLNASRMEVYVSHAPGGTSMQNMEHWAQAVRNDSFQMYDWGSPEANMQHYNQTQPPLYRLDAIKSPVALFTGSNDLLADPTDVQRLMAELAPGTLVAWNNQPLYDHIDFSWGVDCATRIYPDIVKLLRDAAVAGPPALSAQP